MHRKWIDPYILVELMKINLKKNHVENEEVLANMHRLYIPCSRETIKAHRTSTVHVDDDRHVKGAFTG